MADIIQEDQVFDGSVDLNSTVSKDGTALTATFAELNAATAAIALNTTHRSSDGSDHGFIDQDVTSGSTPVFDVTNFTGSAAGIDSDATAHAASDGTSHANVPTADEKAGLAANTPTAANPVQTEVERQAMYDDLGTPAAAAAASVHANYNADQANAFPGPITDPDVPRNLSATFNGAWDGGDLTIDGTDQFDNVIQEVIADNPGATVLGVEIFKTVTAITKQTVGAAAQPASVGYGDKLGVDQELLGPVGVIAVDGVTEAGTWDATYHAVTPTTVPNGARQYDAFFPY